MRAKLEDLRVPVLDWVERLDLVNEPAQLPAELQVEGIEDDGDVSAEDDFKRELKL